MVTRFDWGEAPNGDAVNRDISARIMASVELMMLSTIISIVIGVGLGVYTAQRQYQTADRAWSGIASVFMVIPTVVLAILIVFFAIEINTASGTRTFRATPATTFSSPSSTFSSTSYCPPLCSPSSRRLAIT